MREQREDKELEAGERRCGAGESSHSPAVCGATAAPGCGAALTAMSKEGLDQVTTGFGTCTGPQAGYAAYKADSLRFAIKDLASKCGYADNILDPSINAKAAVNTNAATTTAPTLVLAAAAAAAANMVFLAF